MNIDKLSRIQELIKNKKRSIIGNHKFFAVMIPLVEKDGKIHILYEVRSATISTQPKEVSFPGGKIEEGETAKEAAIRETFEEIGISEDKIKILGEGDKLIALANFTIYTYYGFIKEEDLKYIKLNPDEVERYFLVPIEFFMENNPEIYTFKIKQFAQDNFPFQKVNISPDYRFMDSKRQVPIYSYEGEAIWGLTGKITKNFIEMLKKDMELETLESK